MVWDEENRLVLLSDDGNGNHYIYGHTGERVVKAQTGLQLPPGNPTQKTQLGQPEETGQAIPTVTGNYEVPRGWPKPVAFAPPGGPPGPPVQFGDPVTNDNVQAGYGYTKNALEERDQYFYHPDHLGSTSIITDREGIATQFVAYMPFGESLVDEHSSRKEMPYKFSGKERDEETGLSYFGARYFDPATGVWYGIDPMAGKYLGVGGYVYCVGNPVKYIDPTGMDWYYDKDKTRQYNPELTKNNQAEKLGAGQKYIGATDAVTDKNGNVIENYRKDGSIMFSKESSGYSRIWNNSQKTGNEEMGVITDKGVLVVPNYKNTPGEVNLSDYKYSVKDGNVVDVSGKSFNTAATVHTHLNGTGPSLYHLNPDGSGGWGDLGLAANGTPNKPVFVLHNNGKNTISVIQSASANGRLTQGFNQYTVQNITSGMPNFNVEIIQSGGASLRQFTRQYSSYLRTFYDK